MRKHFPEEIMKITSISLKKSLSFLFSAAILTGILISCTPSTGNHGSNVPDVSSVQMAQNMAIGWNLGNTLDATPDWTDNNGVFHSELKGIETEECWGMPKTTKTMITAIKNAGFKTIRIPVSWHNHITDTTNYTIDSAWMARVKEIVDWAYNKNMYVIINIHHDNLSISDINGHIGFALSDNTAIQTQSKKYIEKVWTQIATTFASYDNRLVFEVLNEPRDVGGEFKGNEWWTNNQEMINIITSYEQVGINAIRSVAGNENRFIMVPGYAASGSDSSMLSLYTMPTDTATDKLLLSAHAYSPYAFAMYDSNQSEDDTVFDNTDKASLDSIFKYLKENYTDKGIGVVMGEASATDKNNLSERIAWATYYFTKAKEAGIPVVLWDNMVTEANEDKTKINIGERHGYYDRNANTWYFPTMIQAMMKAVYGDNYTAQ
jgi:endoglucanase